jgi:hypothetical protein
MYTSGCQGVENRLTIEVADQGKGLSPEMVREVTNFERFGGTKYFVKKPSRGAQGNALMTIVGLVAALWREQGMSAPSGADPNPIPGGIQPFGPGTEVFHIFLPGPDNEPSTITDFHGFVGLAHITGSGTANPGNRHVFFDNDVRFMKGPYIGVDGKQRNGTFGFF